MLTSTATWGGKREKSWCAQSGPGGRPSMGPVPPPNAGSTACCVWFDCSDGGGLSVETGNRGSTSKRGIGWLNFPIPTGAVLGHATLVVTFTPPPPPPPLARAIGATVITAAARTTTPLPYSMV